MANFDTIENNKGKLNSSVDEALLEEFLSVIAGITVRLVKDNSTPPNENDNNQQTGEQT